MFQITFYQIRYCVFDLFFNSNQLPAIPSLLVIPRSSKVEKTLLTLCDCSGAMAFSVEIPFLEEMVAFKDYLGTVCFNKLNAIGIHVGNGENQNVLCPATVWFEYYHKYLYSENSDSLSYEEKSIIQKEAFFIGYANPRHKMMSTDFCDIELIYQEKH